MTGPQERKALEYWLSDRGIEAKDLGKLLPTLEVGKPLLWSPQWLKRREVVEILPIGTSDTSRTPKFGTVSGSFELRPIDISALKEKLAEATESVAKDDPKALRARIKELETLVTNGAGPAAAQVVVFDKKKAEKLRDSHDSHMSRAQQLLQWEHAELQEIHDRIEKLLGNSKQLEQHLESSTFAEDLEAFLDDVPLTDGKRAARKQRWSGETVPSTKQQKRVSVEPSVPFPTRASMTAAPASDLEKVDRLMLQVLHIHGRMTLGRCAMLAGYPVTASTTRNAASRLRSAGLIDGDNADMGITTLGTTKTGNIEKLPRGPKQLLEYWCGRLERVDGEMLRVLAKRYPTPMTYDDLAKAAGYEPKKSTARNAASRLRGLGLVEGKNTKGILIRKELSQ